MANGRHGVTAIRRDRRQRICIWKVSGTRADAPIALQRAQPRQAIRNVLSRGKSRTSLGHFPCRDTRAPDRAQVRQHEAANSHAKKVVVQGETPAGSAWRSGSCLSSRAVVPAHAVRTRER
ncbi:UNVERIFIED_ORG: hypothetical protein GGD48_004973 [Rhizobium etli]